MVLTLFLGALLAIAGPAPAAPPVITGFTPQVGTVGTLVKIAGVGLDSVASVQFNGAEAKLVVLISSTHIKAVVPPSGTSGPISVEGPSGVDESDQPFLVEPPGGIRLAFTQPRPNPSRGPVAWRFSLHEPGRACLAIYNVRGRRVRLLCSDFSHTGAHELPWDGRDASGTRLPAGVYCGMIEAGGQRDTRCVTLVR